MAARPAYSGGGGTGPRPVLGVDIGATYLNMLEKAFKKADIDESGSLSSLELQKMWQYMFVNLHPKDVWRVTDPVQQDLDPNRDGQVSWPELEKFFTGQASVPTEVDGLISSNLVERKPNIRELTWAVFDVDAPSYTVDTPVWLPFMKQLISFISNTTIIASILNFIIESMAFMQKAPDAPEDRSSTSFVAEAICIAIFTTEFFFRTVSCPQPFQFWTSFYTWVDVLAILPFYVGVGLGSNPSGSLVVLRVLRLLRLVRMLKLGRSLEAVQVLIIAIQRTIKPLLVAMVGINMIAVVLFASLIFTVEKEEAEFNMTQQKWVRLPSSSLEDAGEVIMFQSIPESMWWAWVTLTTVGYGDMYPSTGAGKAVASLTMICGLIVMSFPLTLLACSFAETMGELKLKKVAQSRGSDFLEAIQKLVQIEDVIISPPGPHSVANPLMRESQDKLHEIEKDVPRWTAPPRRHEEELSDEDIPSPPGPVPPAQVAERRVDCDGSALTKQQFIAVYGSTAGWDAAKPDDETQQMKQSIARIENQVQKLSSTLELFMSRSFPPPGGFGVGAFGEQRLSEPDIDGIILSVEDTFQDRSLELGPSPKVSAALEVGEMIILTYISQQVVGLSMDDVSSICTASRKNNSAAAIAARLVVSPPYFLQTIEGPAQAVHALMERISKDTRHHSVEVVSEHTLMCRQLKRWPMACVMVRPASRAELLRVATELTRRRSVMPST